MSPLRFATPPGRTVRRRPADAGVRIGVDGEITARLLTVHFGTDDIPSRVGTRALRLDNRVLGDASRTEVWVSQSPISRGRLGPVFWAENGNLLLGFLQRPLTGALEAETREHFRALFELLDARGYSHLLRVWNFLPGINAIADGVERYRRFNVGRAEAFDDRYGAESAQAHYCASSAVGTRGDSLTSYFAASRRPGRQLGNPRQVDAYHYPEEYGDRPPSFSRATIAPAEAGDLLFLSGTASITDHRTRHVGRVMPQLEETLRNIDSLLDAHDEYGSLPALPEFDWIRVYLRHAADLDAVRDSLRQRLGDRPQVIFLEADICRIDLLVEIEGVARLSSSTRDRA